MRKDVSVIVVLPAKQIATLKSFVDMRCPSVVKILLSNGYEYEAKVVSEAVSVIESIVNGRVKVKL